MKRLLYVTGLAVVIFVLYHTGASAQTPAQPRQYTPEAPLVYEDSWDLWPYAFLNETGEPMGYNIDLVRMLLDELHIPYTVKLKSRRDALTDLKEGRADLTCGMNAAFHDIYGSYGKSVIQLFTHSIVTPKGQPVTIHNMQDMKNTPVIVHRNSFSHYLMKEAGLEANAIPYDYMRDAVQDVSTKGKGCILWNTASLQWLVRMYQIDNLQISPINIPHGEYKFISNDTLLLARLDSAFSVLNSNNMVEPVLNKWFYPERVDTGIPSWIWYLTNTAVIMGVILLFTYTNYRIRERKLNMQGQQRVKRLSLILQVCQIRIWTYDTATQTFTWMDKDGHEEHKQSSMEFSRHFHAADYEQLYEGIRQLTEMEENSMQLELKMRNKEADNDSEREYRIALSVLRRQGDKPTAIMGTMSDITEEHEKQKTAREQLLRYQAVFNTAMIDMVYYDREGNIVDMNERVKQTFFADRTMPQREGTNIRDLIESPDLNLEEMDNFHATIFLNRPDETHNAKPASLKDTKFYELHLEPVFDPSHQLLGVYGSGLDVTEVARAYRQVQKGIRDLRKATEEVTEYVNNINYVLGVGGVRMATYSPESHTLTIFKELNVVQQSLTQSRCMTLVDDQSKKTAMRMLDSMDALTTQPIETVIKTSLHLHGMPLYLQFRFVPTYGEDGQVAGYFGLCRDFSDMKNTEMLLAKETVRAQEVENLKNAFLRNMSYEIRTPLNSVVGFAELFEQEHAPEDEAIFIQEIKNSSAHLLNLINDILFLSRLDAHMIEIKKEDIDFAQTFESHCQLGWANAKKEDVRYVVDNPYEQLVVDIDDANLGRVIEQITLNAAQHTSSGTVRARYDYIGGKLVISVVDTGNGMSPEVLKRIYERFSSNQTSGTGLGLPICQELVKQLGGTMDISSEESKGTTVWLTIPCTATAIVRKKDI